MSHMTVSAVNKTLFDGIRTKCHNADGEIRIQQKFYRDVTKVLQGCNMV